MCLLIVDDSELMRKVTRLAFPGAAEIDEATNGLEALARLATARQPFDAIVLDLQMPDMNGVEFLRALQQVRQLGVASAEAWDCYWERYCVPGSG